MQRQAQTFRCRRCLSGMAPFCGALMRGRRRVGSEDRDAVLQRGYHTRAGDIVFRRDGAAEHIFAVCEGWALRFIELADGRPFFCLATFAQRRSFKTGCTIPLRRWVVGANGISGEAICEAEQQV
jgi:hypothetical protein